MGGEGWSVIFSDAYLPQTARAKKEEKTTMDAVQLMSLTTSILILATVQVEMCTYIYIYTHTHSSQGSFFKTYKLMLSYLKRTHINAHINA